MEELYYPLYNNNNHSNVAGSPRNWTAITANRSADGAYVISINAEIEDIYMKYFYLFDEGSYDYTFSGGANMNERFPDDYEYSGPGWYKWINDTEECEKLTNLDELKLEISESDKWYNQGDISLNDISIFLQNTGAIFYNPITVNVPAPTVLPLTITKNGVYEKAELTYNKDATLSNEISQAGMAAIFNKTNTSEAIGGVYRLYEYNHQDSETGISISNSLYIDESSNSISLTYEAEGITWKFINNEDIFNSEFSNWIPAISYDGPGWYSSSQGKADPPPSIVFKDPESVVVGDNTQLRYNKNLNFSDLLPLFDSELMYYDAEINLSNDISEETIADIVAVAWSADKDTNVRIYEYMDNGTGASIQIHKYYYHNAYSVIVNTWNPNDDYEEIYNYFSDETIFDEYIYYTGQRGEYTEPGWYIAIAKDDYDWFEKYTGSITIMIKDTNHGSYHENLTELSDLNALFLITDGYTPITVNVVGGNIKPITITENGVYVAGKLSYDNELVLSDSISQDNINALLDKMPVEGYSNSYLYESDNYSLYIYYRSETDEYFLGLSTPTESLNLFTGYETLREYAGEYGDVWDGPGWYYYYSNNSEYRKYSGDAEIVFNENGIFAEGLKLSDFGDLIEKVDGYSPITINVASGEFPVSAYNRAIKIHRVRWFDYDGSLIATTTVFDGQAAVPPELPDYSENDHDNMRPALTFHGWTLDYSKVTYDLDIGAIWDTSNGETYIYFNIETAEQLTALHTTYLILDYFADVACSWLAPGSSYPGNFDGIQDTGVYYIKFWSADGGGEIRLGNGFADATDNIQQKIFIGDVTSFYIKEESDRSILYPMSVSVGSKVETMDCRDLKLLKVINYLGTTQIAGDFDDNFRDLITISVPTPPVLRDSNQVSMYFLNGCNNLESVFFDKVIMSNSGGSTKYAVSIALEWLANNPKIKELHIPFAYYVDGEFATYKWFFGEGEYVDSPNNCIIYMEDADEEIGNWHNTLCAIGSATGSNAISVHSDKFQHYSSNGDTKSIRIAPRVQGESNAGILYASIVDAIKQENALTEDNYPEILVSGTYYEFVEEHPE